MACVARCGGTGRNGICPFFTSSISTCCGPPLLRDRDGTQTFTGGSFNHAQGARRMNRQPSMDVPTGQRMYCSEWVCHLRSGICSLAPPLSWVDLRNGWTIGRQALQGLRTENRKGPNGTPWGAEFRIPLYWHSTTMILHHIQVNKSMEKITKMYTESR